jgi:hypothetical protein
MATAVAKAAVAAAPYQAGYLTGLFTKYIPHANRVPNIYDVALQAIQKTFASTSWVTTYSLTTKAFKVLRADPIVTTVALVGLTFGVVKLSGKAKEKAVAGFACVKDRTVALYKTISSKFTRAPETKDQIEAKIAILEAQLSADKEKLSRLPEE